MTSIEKAWKEIGIAWGNLGLVACEMKDRQLAIRCNIEALLCLHRIEKNIT